MESKDFVFGKGILFRLTTGLYKNEFVLYREYVQNAADSIDAAIECGLMDERDAQISITVDREKRRIVIRDNAMGIPSKDVKRMLCNVGNSVKDSRKHKGFMGIGRLGGLGYCDKMVFETTSKGDSEVNVISWNASLLRKLIDDKTGDDDAVSVLVQVTKHTTRKCNELDHYFQVTLEGISETSDELLDEEAVKQYLRMVAPVGFNYSAFLHKKKIADFVQAHRKEISSLCSYNVFVNNDLILKGYAHTLCYNGKEVKVEDVHCDLLKQNGIVIGWYWIGCTTLEFALTKGFWQSGIRLRRGNIQIGERETLKQLWPENGRGNNYYIGEVHITDPEILPTAQRDYFVTNVACRRMEKCLRTLFDSLWKMCRAASDNNSIIRQINAQAKIITDFNAKESGKDGGFSNQNEEKRQHTKAEQAQKTIQKLQSQLEEKQKKQLEKSESSVTKVILKTVYSHQQEPPKKTVTVAKPAQKEYLDDQLSDEGQQIMVIVQKVLKARIPDEEECTVILNEIRAQVKKIS